MIYKRKREKLFCVVWLCLTFLILQNPVQANDRSSLPKEITSIVSKVDRLLKKGRTNEANEKTNKAISLSIKKNGKYSVASARTLESLGHTYKRYNKLADALRLFRAALKSNEEAFGESSTNSINILHNLGEIYLRGNNHLKALELYSTARHRLEATFTKDSIAYAKTIEGIAKVYLIQKRSLKAVLLFEKSISIRKSLPHTSRTELAFTFGQLASALTQQKKIQRAVSVREQALAIYKRELGNEHSLVGNELYNLSILYRKSGNAKKALEFAERGHKILASSFGDTSISSAFGLKSIAEIYIDLGRLNDAENKLIAALNIFEKKLRSPNYSALSIRRSLASVAINQGHKTKAEALLIETRNSIIKGNAQIKYADVFQKLTLDLKKLYKDQGRYKDAKSLDALEKQAPLSKNFLQINISSDWGNTLSTAGVKNSTHEKPGATLGVVLAKKKKKVIVGLKPKLLSNGKAIQKREAVEVNLKNRMHDKIFVGSVVWIAPKSIDQVSGQWELLSQAEAE